jgi:hypothetical protein
MGPARSNQTSHSEKIAVTPKDSPRHPPPHTLLLLHLQRLLLRDRLVLFQHLELLHGSRPLRGALLPRRRRLVRRNLGLQIEQMVFTAGWCLYGPEFAAVVRERDLVDARQSVLACLNGQGRCEIVGVLIGGTAKGLVEVGDVRACLLEELVVRM